MLHPLAVSLLTLLAGAVWLIAYDVWLYHRGGGDATISWQTWLASKRHPVIPLLVGFLLGLLLGHLFWTQS